MGSWLVVVACLFGLAASNYPVFDVNTQMQLLLVPADARIGSVIYRLRATDSDRDYPLMFAATDYGSYVIKIDNLPCQKNSSFCEANVFLERTLIPGQLFKFRVTVRDTKGDTTTLPVSIKVTNGITDFNEVFPHVPGVVMIPESTKVGTELEYVIVKKNPRSVRKANLELWGSPEFKFVQSSKKDTTTGIITLAAPLDYETKTMYRLSVFATGMWVDLATDTRNIAGFQLVIVVSDVQDTPPVFDHIEPITKLNPNLTEGEVVLRVTARDGDKGSPRPIKYGLVSEGNPFTVFFDIDQDTGDIRLVRPLKELTSISRSHQPILLTVIAEEQVVGGKDHLTDISSTATVALLLGQLGNTPPYFASHNYVTHVAENSIQGTALVFNDPYITEVKDNDMGKHGVFSLTLENNNGTFEITPNVGERQASFIIRVRDNTLLDYEVNKELSFKIWAKELSPDQKPLSTSVNVVVYVMDVNDNPPIFSQSNYSSQVAENATAVTQLAKFEATDVDTGDGGIIKYTAVLGMKNTSLSLHPDTGVLKIATDTHGFDREESSSYQFFIEAKDMKGSGNRATVPFTLYILDVNDETPTFEKSPIEFILGPGGTNFSQRAFIKATDADAESPNNIVRYEIVSGNYDSRFILIAETGELLVNPRVRVSRQTKDSVSDLLVRAYDLGVPTRWSTAQLRIFPAESNARVMRFLVPGRNPDRRAVQQLLSDLTGARVVIHSIEPYNQPYYPGQTTDLTSGGINGERSVVTATVLYNNNAVIDLDSLQKKLNNNRTAQLLTDEVTVYRSETRTLFWILMILLILIALALLTLLLCCCCECCPFYAFFNRLVRRKSAVQAVNTVTYTEKEKENKSVQAEWIQNGRKEAWSADQPRRNWHFNRRNSGNKILLMAERQPPPNIIYTREVGEVQRHNNDLFVEDVDGTEYRILDASKLAIHPHHIQNNLQVPLRQEIPRQGVEGRPPSRDERFIRDGNAEILRLVTRGRDEEEDEDGAPTINRPERPFTMEHKPEENEGKVDIMRRFIEESDTSEQPEAKEETENENNEHIMRRVMEFDDKQLSTADVSRLTTIQRDLLLTRFLVEEHRRTRNANIADDTQSLPGVVAMATQTDSHAQTQTERAYFSKRKTKSDNDESFSDSEENCRRRFKRNARFRLQEEDTFQNRSTDIKTPIIEEAELPSDLKTLNSKTGQIFTETKASLLRHAATKVRLGDDHESDSNLSKPNHALYRMRSMSDQDINLSAKHRENVVRSLQVTPMKQISITNNVLVEHVVHPDSPTSEQKQSESSQEENVRHERKSRVASVPSTLTVRPPVKRQSSSEPRTPSRQSSKETVRRSSSQEKEAAPRYMEWYKKKREMREEEKRKQKNGVKPQQNRAKNTQRKNVQKAPPVVEVDEEKDQVSLIKNAPLRLEDVEQESHFFTLMNVANEVNSKSKNEEDRDSGIAVQYTIGPNMTSLRNQQALEKKSIFTIAYNDMETKQIRIDTASPP
ncbi:cadherin-86C [Cimex lectularius]|uniref:Cadherin domain-containing protein n=1 Tax=Cimex lectularius TaxID=79782 RepID=A0A8I6RSS0_CIMLE|nr:cadherin-86C [Cimex lectularius]